MTGNGHQFSDTDFGLGWTYHPQLASNPQIASCPEHIETLFVVPLTPASLVIASPQIPVALGEICDALL
jgi:hypothetical protein